MTGLLGGGHAIYWDGRHAVNLDCFVTVPRGQGGDVIELAVPFGEEVVHYAVGPGTCGVPGLPAGLHALWERFGRLSWPRLVEPALRLARSGVQMPPAHAACLEMLGPVFTLTADGKAIYAPEGELLRTGETLAQPGLEGALELVAAEGAATVYRARSPKRCSASTASGSRRPTSRGTSTAGRPPSRRRTPGPGS